MRQDGVFGGDGGRIDQVVGERSSQDDHGEFVQGHGTVGLAPLGLGSVVATVLDGGEFVGAGVKAIHSIQHLTLLVHTPIQEHSIR